MPAGARCHFYHEAKPLVGSSMPAYAEDWPLSHEQSYEAL
jgi:hypothetical protein